MSRINRMNLIFQFVGPQMSRRLSMPQAQWSAILLLPLIVSGYCMLSMGIVPNFAGCIDQLFFAAAFGVLYAFTLIIPSQLWRAILAFVGILLLVLLCFANVLYFRFFQSWPHADIFKQVGDLPHIWSGIVSLLTPWDFLVVVIPLGLWRVSLVRQGCPRRPGMLALVLCAGGLLILHQGLMAKGLSYPEHHPVCWFMRQSMHQEKLREQANEAMREVSKRIDDLRPINQTIYRGAGLERFPFVKAPHNKIPKLPIALEGKPNIVLVLMESMRSYESGAYGAKISFTPNFDRLAKEGVLFRNFYANGSMTVRGEFALLASFVPKYIGGPIYETFPDVGKVTLPSILKEHGYKTMWISSFSPDFHNKREFLESHGIDEFHTVHGHLETIGWGPADTELFDFAANVLSRQEEPFFAEITTLSNHFPFKGPFPTSAMTPQVNADKLYTAYTCGIFYTDWAVGKFADQIRDSAWAKNTIFVFTSDHGIWVFPPDRTLLFDAVRKQELYWRVPLLIWSPHLLKPESKTTLGSQLDVAPTLLDLLDIHVKNDFLGTSLFRDDVAQRFVFMLRDGSQRWNLRLENEFVYDVGPGAYTDPIVGPAPHKFFRYEGDFLHVQAYRDYRELPQSRQRALREFAERALNGYYSALISDRIWPGN